MLRGVFDGGGLRKQNGHWQSSGGISPVLRHVFNTQVLNIVSSGWNRYFPEDYNTTHYGDYLRFHTQSALGTDPYYNKGGTSGDGLGGRRYSASSGTLTDYPFYDDIKNAVRIGFTISANDPTDQRVQYLIVPAFVGSGQGSYQGVQSQIGVNGGTENDPYLVQHFFSPLNLASTEFTLGYYKLNTQDYQPPEDNPYMGGYIVGTDGVDVAFTSPIAEPYQITDYSFRSFFAFAFNAPAMGNSHDPIEIKIEWWYEK